MPAKAPTQPATIRCEACRALVRVVAQSPYEFTYRCACGRGGVIAWAHAAPPPQFTPPAPQQLSLFEETDR
jgi:hypothetical protein